MDKLCATYSVSRNTNRWPMVVFYTMLNVGAINAQIVYLENNSNSQELRKRRYFIKNLAKELVAEHVKKRSQITYLPVELNKRALELSAIINGETEDSELSKDACKRFRKETEVSGTKENSTVRKRCYICGRKKNRMTKYKCNNCKNFICLDHSENICICCSNKTC